MISCSCTLSSSRVDSVAGLVWKYFLPELIFAGTGDMVDRICLKLKENYIGGEQNTCKIICRERMMS